VREYTTKEVVSLLIEAGFEVVKAYYSIVNDLTYINADPEEYLRISSFKDLARIVLKNPTKLNILRLLAYPIAKIEPSLRQLIVAIVTKAREPAVQVLER
jgi:predicted ATP-grasp superfamily ATP-dependent carboligase